MTDTWDSLKVLSDPTRLRLLALLLKEELSVAELQEILGMGQSRISSQLALLRQAGFVTDRRDGKKAFYSLRTGLPAKQLTLLRAACDSVADLPESAEDRGSLDRTLHKRRQHSEQYFNLIAGKLGKNYCPGRSWEALGHLALRLVPAITVADLGAGEGLVSQLLARETAHVFDILRARTDPARWLAERDAILQGDWPAKAFLRMRVSDTSDDVHGRMPNPLRVS